MSARNFAAAGAALPADRTRLSSAAQSTDSDVAPVPAEEAGYGTAVPPQARAAPAPATPAPAPAAPTSTTYEQEDVLSAAEGVFGRGAEGLAKMVETIAKDLGQPNAYIAGREAGGAFVLGVRYGSGTLFHKVEGQMPVFWTGPSVGVDVGGDGNKTFTLVYNLNDSGELFRRYPAVEGKVYVIGGFTANYLQRDNVVLVPIKLGVGWRLGANVGYVNYTKTSRLLPF
jgi:hypothetical protein